MSVRGIRRTTSLHTSRREALVAAAPDAVWAAVASARTGPQWYVDALPLRVRRTVDRLAGGLALAVPPPGRPTLLAGDEVGFWRVVTADGSARRLALVARVRSPGRVRLEVHVDPDRAGSRLGLAVTFEPHGLTGRAYEVLDLPAREAVCELLLRALVDAVRA